MKALLEKRAKIFEEGRALVLKAEQETRALTSEEQTKYDAIMADVRALGETIERSRQSAEFSAELDKSIGPLRTAPAPGTDPGSDLREAAMVQFIRGGVRSLSDEQRSAFGQAITGSADQLHFRAASPLSAVTGSAGADMIPTGFVQKLEAAMKWFGGMRQSRAFVLRTTAGNELPWPTMDDTDNEGELVSENSSISQAATEMSFGQVTFNAWKYSSKLVLVPIELIQDSAFDVQGLVANKLGERLGRITNKHYTNGTGSSQPNGVVTAATLGVTGATGETTSATYDDFVSLIHSVDPAYRVGAEFMFNDSTAAAIEKLKDGNGRPLLNSSLQGITAPVRAGEPGRPGYTINGYPVVVNSDVPTMAANAKSILFGDFSKYVIRDVMDLMLVRFGEKYMDKGQIGFVAFLRTDGDLVDAGMHPIKYFANSAT